MKNLAILFAAILYLTGCATSYQPQGFSGGYSETKLGENIFRVSFRGNGYTSRERASDFTLLRSADLALQNGFNYFVVVTSDKATDVSAFTTPTTSHTTGSIYGNSNYAYGSATTTTHGGNTYFVSKPSMMNTIICYKEKPDINGMVFDARFISREIRRKYAMEPRLNKPAIDGAKAGAKAGTQAIEAITEKPQTNR